MIFFNPRFFYGALGGVQTTEKDIVSKSLMD
jgi:hypothetical protein